MISYRLPQIYYKLTNLCPTNLLLVALVYMCTLPLTMNASIIVGYNYKAEPLVLPSYDASTARAEAHCQGQMAKKYMFSILNLKFNYKFVWTVLLQPHVKEYPPE